MRAVVMLLLGAAACDDGPEDAREAQVVAVLASADEPYIRTRPALAAGKYVRMASDPFAFYRGGVPVFRNDMRNGSTTIAVSRFALDLPLVPSVGDPHPENFGALRAADGSLALEPNDFDSADQAPYLWDVGRLASGMVLAATLANVEDRRTIARASVDGYRVGIEAAARGTPPPRITEPNSPVLEDVFRRSERDQAERRELVDLTVLADGRRRLKRGVLDPEDPQNVYADLPSYALDALPAAIERWRLTLVAPPPAEHVRLIDAVREFGSGVASWPRLRVILLVRGPTDDPSDDLLLELKELADSGIGGLQPPGVYQDSVGERVVRRARAAWARPDAEPLWGWSDLLGFPCQIRLQSEGQKSVRVARLVEDRGSPEALSALGRTLGTIVARVHSSGPRGIENARAIYKRFAQDAEGFADEQADLAVAYAALVLEDHVRFRRFLAREEGLRLGIPFDANDAARPDVATLFGTPPPLPPLP